MEDADGSLNPFSDLDLDSSARPQRAISRTRKFQPNNKGKLLKSEPSDAGFLPPPSPLPPSIKEQEDLPPVKESKPFEEPSHPLTIVKEDEEEEVATSDANAPMDVDKEEDVVVREIDVFFNPSPLDTDTQLYVMQYPLRPSWRPYELNERCQEVRVKPKQSKIEFDMAMDVDSENYDDEVDESLRLQMQTLSSSKMPFVTGYAVGILMGNQLYLNPVHAVVQLRPSMAHIKVGELQKRKLVARRVEANADPDEVNGEESAKPSVKQEKPVPGTSTEKIDDAESWISLEYHAMNSPFSRRYQQKMVAEENGPIHFSMSSSDYINILCPGTSDDNSRTKGPSKRILLSKPLEERLEFWLSEGPQVHRFAALMHLAPDDSVEHVLKLLKQYADLVQGLWVSKSSLLYEGFQASVRDYILFLFSKNTLVHSDKLKAIKLPHEILKRILRSLAVERPAFNDWKFKEPTDLSFIKQHPDIVEEQECDWSRREKHIMDAMCRTGKNIPVMTKTSQKPGMANPGATPGSIEHGGNRSKDGTLSSGTATTMTDETREALPKALLALFRNHKVCSLNLICQGLREMAVTKSSLPKADSRTAVAAAHGASAPLPELQSFISQIAVNIHGVYVLKSLGNPALDPLRNVVIDLLRTSQKLKRAEIVEAAKIKLKRDISNSEYTQVLSELCVSKGGAWMLKSGDGKPN